MISTSENFEKAVRPGLPPTWINPARSAVYELAPSTLGAISWRSKSVGAAVPRPSTARDSVRGAACSLVSTPTTTAATVRADGWGCYVRIKDIRGFEGLYSITDAGD